MFLNINDLKANTSVEKYFCGKVVQLFDMEVPVAGLGIYVHVNYIYLKCNTLGQVGRLLPYA